jgi:hypothetical protein
MRHLVDPREKLLFDLHADWLSPTLQRELAEGWQGLFRRSLLELLPAQELGRKLHECIGRPSKELYSVAGLLLVMELKDWTVDEAVHAYRFDLALQYALNLPPGGRELCEKTIDRYRKVFREDELAQSVMQRVTAKLVELTQVRVERQRLDSTHVFSHMAVLGRSRLMIVVAKNFLKALRKRDEAAYLALPEPLRARYETSPERLFGATGKDPEKKKRLRQEVAEDLYELLTRFETDERFRTLKAFCDLRTVFEQQCEVKEKKVTLRPKVEATALCNPSDPDATYDGHKGVGYQTQVTQTFSEEGGGLVTTTVPQTAAERDSQAVVPLVQTLKGQDLKPEELVADTAYGSDDNVVQCDQEDITLISPVNVSKLDETKLHLEDFEINDDGSVKSCPAGHAPESCQRDADSTTVHMDSRHCQDCDRRDQCPVKGKKKRGMDYTDAEGRRAQRRKNEKTAEFREAYSPRAGIEGVMSALKRRTGLGRLRVRGKPAVFTAIYLKVAGWNILRATALLAKKRKKEIASLHRSPNPLSNPLQTLISASWRTPVITGRWLIA